MEELVDKLTYIIKVATDVLFVKNPVGTSMGVLVGVILHGVVLVITPAFMLFQSIKLSNLTMLHFIAIGVFSFNVKGYLNRNKISPEIEEAISFIDEQVSSGRMTKLEAKQRYRELTSKVIENIIPNPSVRAEDSRSKEQSE